MILKDLHTHTNFSDGKNTAEEMVLSAISKNMECIGFSDHSYTEFDLTYCIPKDKLSEYKTEINRLKEKYKDKIKILLGIEQDMWSNEPCDCYDYVIGSVHYMKCGDEYLEIDHSPELFFEMIEKYFDNNGIKLAEQYYDSICNFDYSNVDIVGHFDLITKFNELDKRIDENDERYKKAYRKAVDYLLTYNIPFEINTGAIARGYRTTPYPNCEIIDYIKEKGGRFVLSSDSHSAENIMFLFDKYKELVK
ncbi:MAG: histidinol-phosphatase [Clostridia bacterium]|nr:histidinol-phosphatase [Clostridia bacterium]